VVAFVFDYHPYSKSMQIQDLASLDMERVLQIYNERFTGYSDFTFVIVGNYDEKQLKHLCTKYLANLPGKPGTEQPRDVGLRVAKGVKDQSIYKGQDEKSIVQFIISGETDINSKSEIELRNLSLLMNEKLRENIRETRSGVYYIGAYGETILHPVPQFQITIYMQCAPERVEELSEAVTATLDSLKAGEFEDKYVNVVKVTRQKRFETDAKDNRWWLGSIYDQASNGFPVNDLLKDMNTINTLTHKDLKLAAEKYLNHRTNLLRSALYPAPRLE